MTPCRKKQYSKILINTSVHSCTKFSRHAAGAEFYMFDPLCHLRNTCTHVCVSATAGAAIASNRWTCRMTCLKIAALFGRPTSFGSFFLEQGVPNKIVILLGIRHGPTFCSDAGLCLPKSLATEHTIGIGRRHPGTKSTMHRRVSEAPYQTHAPTTTDKHTVTYAHRPLIMYTLNAPHGPTRPR